MTKMVLIGDKETVTGMKLAGLKNSIVADENNVIDKVKSVPEEIDIIVITPGLYSKASKDLARIKEKMIIELPDAAGAGEDMITRMIRDVIGFDTSA